MSDIFTESISKFCTQKESCDFDYWCKDCKIGFCSCSFEGDDHDNNKNNKGHKVYDASRLDDEPVYITGEEIIDKGIDPFNSKPTPCMPIKDAVDILIKKLNKAGVPLPTNLYIGPHEAKFNIEGPRNSIVMYRIWGDGVVDVWFGKSDDDSGGMATQACINRDSEGINKIINLQKRFYQSGRRKVLRNFRRY